MQFKKIKKKERKNTLPQKKKKKGRKQNPKQTPKTTKQNPPKTKTKPTSVSMEGFLLVSLGGFVVIVGLVCLNLTNKV